MTAEKLCLKWNDFQQNIAASLSDLRRDTDFSDVTLVCEEDQQIEAHRIILTTSIPFFSRVLKGNEHSHPMIYMRGLKAKDLAAIVDFIYLGEANIYQEDLDAFLDLAEELKLEGLTGFENETFYGKGELSAMENPVKENRSPKEDEIKEENEKYIPSIANHCIAPVKRELISVKEDISDIKAKIDSMTEKTVKGEYRCTVCGKTRRDKTDIRRHIETHLEGVFHPCNLCGKVSRSSDALRVHVSAYHRKLL
jgi:hypothetical protein